MKIHKEGFPTIIVVTIFIIVIYVLVNIVFPVQTIYHIILYVLSILFLGFILRFFRNPNREIIIDSEAIYAPADGTVVVIEDMLENEYFKGKRKQISIFMSPLNVHINYAPISGKLIYKKYNPGRFLVAWLPKSSQLNESHSIVIKGKHGEILVKQIAGAVARRIVCKACENEHINQGEEFGMIKFGSRVDLYLPIDIKVEAELEQKVKAKKTVIARF